MIVVLGGGPAGRIASMRLASAGKSVMLVEYGGIGGQCLHFGCMPVCALNDAARLVQSSRTFRRLGIFDSVPAINFPRLQAEMLAVQKKITSVLDDETRTAGVDIVYGKTGRVNGKQVLIGDEPVEAEAAIIATGSRPNIPAIGGITLPGVYTPHTLPAMQKLPERLVIIGGNVMAAEYAYIFSSFGSDVTVLSRSMFLKSLDRHLRTLAIRELAGVRIREGIQVMAINGDSRVSSVQTHTASGNDSCDADAVLVAAGLVPRSDMVSGIRKGPAGEVLVDNRMQTSVHSIYAAGDVTGPPYLTPVARYGGVVAADNILGRERRMDYRYIPQSLNLAHELASCGSGGEGAASVAIPGPAGPGTFWSVPDGDTGLAKIMADPGSGEITGVCAAGPGGGIIAGYLAFLMHRHATVHDFEDFIEVHPSTDSVYWLAKYLSEQLKKQNSP
jgi:dihydrolipoamide dehydrogenase